MSAIGIILSFLGFFVSPFGLFAFLLGVTCYMVAPVVPMVTGELHALARLHLWTATRMLKRAAFIITPQNDLLCKRISPDDTGTEKVKFDDDIKEFEDPANRLHWWAGIPFTLADEIHGVFFDPRDAAAGAREKRLEDEDMAEFPATRQEQEDHAVLRWLNAVYEFPQTTHEVVNLSAFRHLIQGSERAEHPERVKTFYENSRAHLMDGTSTKKWIMLIVAMMAPFSVIWVLSSQLGGGGGGGSVVGFGSALLLFGMAQEDAVATAKTLLVAAVVVLPFPLVYFLLFTAVNPVLATFVFIILGAGFWFVPIFALTIGRVSTTLADALSGILFRLGFSGYERPVFEWTPQKYQVRELSKLPDVDESDAAWYGFAGELVGFTFQPGPDSFGGLVADPAEIENRSAAPAGKSSIPSTLRIWDGHVRDRMGGLVPKRLRDSSFYVLSGVFLEQYTYAATGKKSTTRLTQAKDEFGEDHGVSDTRFATLMAVLGLVSFGSGVWLFLL
jgi:hypothetical protein